MPIEITTIRDLSHHLQGVLSRAKDHAGNVDQAALTICALVVLKADRIQVRKYDGRNANMVWVHIAGKRIAITYNHDTQKIDIRDRNQQGKNLESFDNTSIINAIEYFNAL